MNKTTGLLIPLLERRAETAIIRAAMKASTRQAFEIDTAGLKAMWDADWPPGDVLDGIYLEHVYTELVARGEGSYCAI